MKPATAKTGQSETSGPSAKSPTHYPASVDDILKMVEAGVSKEVMKAYIETAQVVSPRSAAEIVAQKEHGVPDDLTVALQRRGAELAAQTNGTGASNAVSAKVSGTGSLNALVAALRSGQLNPGYPDPEGYDYFRHYYLCPRTLTSANERLLSSYPAYPAYSFGYWSPRAFRTRPFAQ